MRSLLGARRGASLIATLSLGRLLAACSAATTPSGSPPHRTTTTPPATTTTSNSIPPASTTTSTTGSSGTVTGVTLVPQSASTSTFQSPSLNISCVISFIYEPDANQATSTSTLCLTASPPNSLTLSPAGAMGRMCRCQLSVKRPTEYANSPIWNFDPSRSIRVLVLHFGRAMHYCERRWFSHFKGRRRLIRQCHCDDVCSVNRRVPLLRTSMSCW